MVPELRRASQDSSLRTDTSASGRPGDARSRSPARSQRTSSRRDNKVRPRPGTSGLPRSEFWPERWRRGPVSPKSPDLPRRHRSGELQAQSPCALPVGFSPLFARVIECEIGSDSGRDDVVLDHRAPHPFHARRVDAGHGSPVIAPRTSSFLRPGGPRAPAVVPATRPGPLLADRASG